MPLYAHKCSCGTSFEVLRPVRDINLPASCPSCGGDDVRRIVASFTAVVAVNEVEPEQFTTKRSRRRPKYITDRSGGGGAALTDSGGYRPTITHHTRCPQCNRMRNVAVLGSFPYGKRLNCEACAYQWIHHAQTAPDPLFDGVDTALRPSSIRSIERETPNHYTLPERGA